MFSSVNTLTISGAAVQPPAQPTAAAHKTDLWTAKADDVADFMVRTGSLPAAGQDSVEDGLAGWLAVQRRAAQQGRIAARRMAYLESRVPGWRQSRTERWDAQLVLLELAKASGAQPHSQLRVWIKSQRRAAAKGLLAPDRKRTLDAKVPGWDRTAVENENQWTGRAEDLANYVDLSGKLPASNSGTAEAAGLYRWMSYQRALARSGKITSKRRKWLDKNVPGWLPEQDCHQVRWSTLAEALVLFVDTNRRWPRATAPAEKTLARWLGTQRAVARAGKLTPSRREKLDSVAAGWLRAGGRS